MLPRYKYVVNDKKYQKTYFLVNGIYPPGAISISKIIEATSRKDKQFASAREALRKDVERTFGMLLSRWVLLGKPFQLWYRKRFAKVMKAEIILHNMVVELRRDVHDSELHKIS